MPLILIHIEDGKNDEQKGGVCADITRAVATYFHEPEQAVRIIFNEAKPNQVSYRGWLKSSEAYKSSIDEIVATNPYAQPELPLVILYTEVGKTDDMFAGIAKGITDAISTHLDIPALAVRIVFEVMEENRVASGGLLESTPEYKNKMVEMKKLAPTLQ